MDVYTVSLDLGRAEPHHGGAWRVRHPSAGPPPPSPQRALPGNPQRREAASHLRDPEEHFCHLSLWLGSKPQWPGWEVGLGKAGMGNGGLRISKPLSSAHLQSGSMNTRSNCVQRKKISKRSLFPFSLEADLLPKNGGKITSPNTITLCQAQNRAKKWEPDPRGRCSLPPVPWPLLLHTQRPSGVISSLPREP